MLSRVDCKNSFNFHRLVIRQRAHAHSRACATTNFFTKNLNKEVRAAIDNARVVFKIGDSINQAQKFDNVTDTIQVAKFVFCNRQEVECGESGVLVGLFHAYILPYFTAL